MTDLFKSKEHEFYIELRQERYYFPGEDISGEVILDLTKRTKTNNIKVVLEGHVELGGRTIILFSKYVLIAQSPDGEKSYYLEPHTHRFPFMITIPTSKECKVPSTLEIAKLVKVNYLLTAIYNKPFAVLEKLSASTTTSINILEDINVESVEYSGDLKVEKELCLTGETRPVKVSTIIRKRAAVKGDTIPISVTIEHIGVMVRDKAISVQLLRSVYYGKNKTELFGPKILCEVTSNIEISGPVNFTKSFNLQLAIPPNLCPTVEKSGQSFRIEYTLRVCVNLNEENPHRSEVPQDIVLFTLPFIMGTYPKLSFNIDDDEDDNEGKEIPEQKEKDEIASNHSSEYDQVAEKMKDLDLSLEAVPPQMIQSPARQQPPSPTTKNNYFPLPAPSSSPKHTYIPPPIMLKQEPRPQVEKNDAIIKPDNHSALTTETYIQVPMTLSPKPIPPMVKTTLSPPSKGSIMSPFPTPRMESATNLGGGTTSTKNSPKLPISHYQSATTISSEQVIKSPQIPTSYHPKVNINPSDIYNDYKPVLSPTISVHQHDSAVSMQPSTSTSTANTTNSSHHALGRKESVYWIVRNQDAPEPATTTTISSPVISTNTNNYPPRPTQPPTSNPSFILPLNNTLPAIHNTAPPPPPFPSNYQEPQQQQQNYRNNNYQPPPIGHQYPPQQQYDNFGGGGMPVPQPVVPQHASNNYNYTSPPPPQYNNYNSPPPPQYINCSSPPPPPPPLQYNNDYNHHPQQNLAFPVPHPHNYAGSMGMMGMPSHQNYQPQQQPPQYNSL